MGVKIALNLPEDVLSAIKKDAEGFAKELRIAAAVKWYEMGVVSQEKASKIAGLSRKEFIEALYRFKVSPVQYKIDDIRQELSRE